MTDVRAADKRHQNLEAGSRSQMSDDHGDAESETQVGR